MQLGPSEFILNADKSIYHLNLLPGDIADTIITVGDPDRVWEVSKYFDFIEVEKHKREFRTHTGRLNNKRLTVISTGIGTDNIDIVMNELDALVNMDFDNRTVKPEHTSLDIVRVGTSGSIQPDIPLDTFVLSELAIGFDNMLHFYDSEEIQHPDIQLAFIDHTKWSVFKSIPYVVRCSEELAIRLRSDNVQPGFTATNVGFYGPQGRKLRLSREDNQLNKKISSFEFEGKRITNMEMETSAIYGLAALLGHRAVSMNCILANRSTGEFSLHPHKAVDELIQYVLDRLTR
ncbi:nucleoside phosphorylase [Muriicola sp. Z0-33]|uniref:nucleoside phosphorylase n=1 Tax=Muriicola sp. Z0-33 TaxID=2816957 RepID=UPI0022374C99|nr:nucleoside phosphorylase [Muriicola sp. Z0-33]MCW5515324.1 nucleoside phosphorylase [Muriicola sp. Z0-33]